jgi:hypothetical protein
MEGDMKAKLSAIDVSGAEVISTRFVTRVKIASRTEADGFGTERVRYLTYKAFSG